MQSSEMIDLLRELNEGPKSQGKKNEHKGPEAKSPSLLGRIDEKRIRGEAPTAEEPKSLLREVMERRQAADANEKVASSGTKPTESLIRPLPRRESPISVRSLADEAAGPAFDLIGDLESDFSLEDTPDDEEVGDKEEQEIKKRNLIQKTRDILSNLGELPKKKSKRLARALSRVLARYAGEEDGNIEKIVEGKLFDPKEMNLKVEKQANKMEKRRQIQERINNLQTQLNNVNMVIGDKQDSLLGYQANLERYDNTKKTHREFINGKMALLVDSARRTLGKELLNKLPSGVNADFTSVPEEVMTELIAKVDDIKGLSGWFHNVRAELGDSGFLHTKKSSDLLAGVVHYQKEYAEADSKSRSLQDMITTISNEISQLSAQKRRLGIEINTTRGLLGPLE